MARYYISTDAFQTERDLPTDDAQKALAMVIKQEGITAAQFADGGRVMVRNLDTLEEARRGK